MGLNIQEELLRLPVLTAVGVSYAPPVNFLQIVSRQGRLLMKLSASAESLDRRYENLALQIVEREKDLEEAIQEKKDAQHSARQIALSAIQLMDALDWVHDSLKNLGQETFARDVEAAQRDCLRRLAGVGVTEIFVTGVFDGRFHEGVETVSAPNVPQYHIVRAVRRGFQLGLDILRRADVVTAL